jgi:hypothetical protein
MSGDEVERAISFLLESQATLTAKVDALADRVDGLTNVANTALEVATSTGETLRAFIDAQGVAQARTDAQIARLASLLEVHVSDGHGGHP